MHAMTGFDTEEDSQRWLLLLHFQRSGKIFIPFPGENQKWALNVCQILPEARLCSCSAIVQTHRQTKRLLAQTRRSYLLLYFLW